jgi:hypothetical protein
VKVYSIVSATAFDVYCEASVIPGGVDSTVGRFVVPTTMQRIADITPGACAGGNARVRLATNSRWGLATDMVIHIVDGVGITGGLNNRGWRVTTVSGKDACLQTSTGLAGTYTANSAIYAIDAPTVNIVEWLGGSASQVWFDRVIVDGGGFPNRAYALISLTGCSNCGVIGSRLLNFGGWLAIDPVTGGYTQYQSTPGDTTGVAIEGSYCQSCLIENNYIEGNGIALFFQQGDIAYGLPMASNVIIRRNHINIPETRRAAGATSDGLHRAHRHGTEFKVGREVLIEGNLYEGNWADEVTACPSIALTVRQQLNSASGYTDGRLYPGEIRDITISKNLFKNVCGILTASYESDSRKWATLPVRRIAVVGNIAQNMDYYTYRSNPSTINGGAGLPTAFTGGTLTHVTISHSFFQDHNTMVREKGTGPALFDESYGIPIARQRITNNLFQDHRTGLAIGSAHIHGAFWAGNVRDSWSTIGQVYNESEASESDPESLFRGNFIIPGSENDQLYDQWYTSCDTSTSTTCNWSLAESNSYWGTGFNTAQTYYHPSYSFAGTTPDARLAEVKLVDYPNGDFRLKSSSPANAASFRSTDGTDIGADPDQVNIARRLIKGLRATARGTTTATVSFTAPVAGDVCYVTNGATRTSDSTNSRIRSVNLTGPAGQRRKLSVSARCKAPRGGA